MYLDAGIIKKKLKSPVRFERTREIPIDVVRIAYVILINLLNHSDKATIFVEDEGLNLPYEP